MVNNVGEFLKQKLHSNVRFHYAFWQSIPNLLPYYFISTIRVIENANATILSIPCELSVLFYFIVKVIQNR